MLKLAGKYADIISRNPVASAVAGGLGAAGLATAGNILSGEATEEGPARVGLEAVGAGALGALMGSRVPYIRESASRHLRNIGAVSYKNAGARARREQMSAPTRAVAELNRDLLQTGVQLGMDPRELTNEVKSGLKRQQKIINATVIPAGIGLAGSLGGVLGGGASNVAQFLGVPGFDQNTIPDPELAASSNTPMARSYTPTLRYLG